VSQAIRAILFDLDGVITDTAEFHYQAWQALADAEGIPFDRAANEKLRGVSRRESLRLLLDGRTLSPEQEEAWLERKNRHYQQLLQQLTPNDLLPGVPALLEEIRAAGLKMAIVSASHNTPIVLERLQIADRFDVVIAGPEADAPPGRNRPKPAPDLFLLAAERLGVQPWECLVVEDAESGVEGARRAGMVTVGLGPVERVGAADRVLPNLDGVTLAQLLYAATWSVAEPGFAPAQQRRWESALTIGNGKLGVRGSLEERFPGDQPATLIHGLWDDAPIVYTELANAFDWTAFELWIDGEPFRMDRGSIQLYSRRLDLRSGELRRHLYWTTPAGATVELSFRRVASVGEPNGAALRVDVTPLDRPVTGAVSVTATQTAVATAPTESRALVLQVPVTDPQVEQAWFWPMSAVVAVVATGAILTGLPLVTAVVVTRRQRAARRSRYANAVRRSVRRHDAGAPPTPRSVGEARGASVTRRRPETIRQSGIIAFDPATMVAQRAVRAGRRGDAAVAEAHFIEALRVNPAFDLTRTPEFWTMSPAGVVAAARAYRRVGRVRDARTLLTVAQISFGVVPVIREELASLPRQWNEVPVAVLTVPGSPRS
jgi:beta-phosphoglucomutase